MVTPAPEELAVSAYLTGRDDDCAELWTCAYREALQSGDVTRAARSAFWLTFALLNRGEQVLAQGWLARARRALDGLDCAERGSVPRPVSGSSS